MEDKRITIDIIQFTAHRLASKLMGWDEPIPEFETRYPNILESCINVPFQKFNRKYLYQGLAGKAAVLFYLMIKNHPFMNGNKRVAVTTLFVFLALNKKWIRVDNKELYNFAVWVAGSNAKLKNEVIKVVEGFIKMHLIDRH